MKFLPTIFRIFNINFQPTNSEHIDMDSVQTRLYPGAHIATGNPYDYFHHGIVIDPTTDDISIVHFWGHKKREAHVQTTTLSTFISGSSTRVASKNRQLYLVHYENDTFEKQQETCQRAKDMLIETPYNYKFHLLRLNCESFARFCRTKEWKSEQVTILKRFPLNNIRNIYRRIKCRTNRNVHNSTEPIQANYINNVFSI